LQIHSIGDGCECRTASQSTCDYLENPSSRRIMKIRENISEGYQVNVLEQKLGMVRKYPIDQD
jgi:hypothetical protein